MDKFVWNLDRGVGTNSLTAQACPFQRPLDLDVIVALLGLSVLQARAGRTACESPVLIQTPATRRPTLLQWSVPPLAAPRPIY